MGEKLYTKDGNGIRIETDRKLGDVRIPNYVFDLWMPLIGAEAIGVYAMYCRLEREQIIKGLKLDDIARACRVGKKTLQTINQTLAEYKFITIQQPRGKARLLHHTTVITVHDPPREISAEVIQTIGHPQGYKPIAVWLVADGKQTEVLDRTSGGSSQNFRKGHSELPDVPDKTSTVLKPLAIEGEASTSVEASRNGADAPSATAPTPEEKAIDALRAELTATLPDEEKAPPSVPLVPPVPPAAPFAHVAPLGTVWITSADSQLGMTVHLGRATSDKSRPLCGAKMPHRTTHIQHGAQPCAACVAKATAPPKPTKAQPPPDVKEFMAILCYGKGNGLLPASWSKLVDAWNKLQCPALDRLEHFKRYWTLADWRGKQAQPPTPYQIVSEWDVAMGWGGYQSAEDEAAKEAAMMAELAAMGKPRAVKRHE
jgi:hypothetical protein